MKDFVVYHNPDAMGYTADQVDSMSVLTNKKVGDVRGDRVWLITGEGNPRKYYIVFWFHIDEIRSGEESGFRTAISGSDGQQFKPMIPINGEEEWFKTFKKNQGNFAFGFSLVKENETIEKLEALAGLR